MCAQLCGLLSRMLLVNRFMSNLHFTSCLVFKSDAYLLLEVLLKNSIVTILFDSALNADTSQWQRSREL